MRHLFGFMCVLALGLIGCSETAGTGGSGGDGGAGGEGGEGGSGGMAGSGGTGGMAGSGGTGGMPECQSLEDCDDFNDCTGNACTDDLCEYTLVADGTECLVVGPFFAAPGLCVAGSCLFQCEVLEEGSACDRGDETGVCVSGSCEPRCENDAGCTDFKDCTADTCLSSGLCESVAVQDGTPCVGGVCQSGECALQSSVVPCTEQGIRNAIAAGGDQPYTFDCDDPTTVTTSAVILIDNDVILDGEGKLSVAGGGNHNVFVVIEGVTTELGGFVVTNGDGQGGGVFNRGNLTVKDSIVSGNTACSTCSGGGIRNEGTLTLVNTTVSGNNAETGAGIHNDNFATATVMKSTVSGNTGGGIRNEGMLTVTNTTVSGTTGGVGILSGGAGDAVATATVTNSTVSGNIAGGIRNERGTLTLTDTLVDNDCVGTIASNGYNIESPGDTCGFDHGTDQVNITEGQLDLGELANNGGPTMTHALGADSVAIDHIPAVDCGVTTDQRDQPRPETGGTMCDVGAFEVQPED